MGRGGAKQYRDKQVGKARRGRGIRARASANVSSPRNTRGIRYRIRLIHLPRSRASFYFHQVVVEAKFLAPNEVKEYRRTVNLNRQNKVFRFTQSRLRGRTRIEKR